MEYEPILPLRAITFQVLFLMVAITIESWILRRRLGFGLHTSVKYTFIVNLAAVVAGWLAFLAVEPLAPANIKAQIISYILFDRLLLRGWTTEIGGTLFGIALVAFFLTFFIKAKGIELIMRSDKVWKIPEKPVKPSREDRYARARLGRTEAQQALATFTDSVLQANAASFTAILLLLVLRAVAEGWTS
ncbi:MAG: filament integrity protein FraC [Cyanobacteria bacterium J06597_16]